MGFLGSIFGAAVKTVVSPIAAVKDVADGTPFETTGEVLGSALDSVEDAVESLFEGDLL